MRLDPCVRYMQLYACVCALACAKGLACIRADKHDTSDTFMTPLHANAHEEQHKRHTHDSPLATLACACPHQITTQMTFMTRRLQPLHSAHATAALSAAFMAAWYARSVASMSCNTCVSPGVNMRIRACMCVCVLSVYTFTHVQVFMLIYTCMCMYISAHTDSCACFCMHVRASLRINMHTCLWHSYKALCFARTHTTRRPLQRVTSSA